MPENYSDSVGIESWIDARFGNSYMGGYNREIQTNHFRIESTEWSPERGLRLVAKTAAKGHRLAVATKLEVDGGDTSMELVDLRRVGELVFTPGRAGESVQFRKLAAFSHDFDDRDPLSRADDALVRLMLVSRTEFLSAPHRSLGRTLGESRCCNRG